MLPESPESLDDIRPRNGFTVREMGFVTINGGFNGKIIYKWAIFHGYVK